MYATTCRTFANRNDLASAVFPKRGQGIEVGVLLGGFSQVLLALTEPRHLLLVDPWATTSEPVFGALPQTTWDHVYAGIAATFAGDERVKIERGKSSDVLPTLPADSFDWVFIDGNHHYEYAAADIYNAARVIKPGGIIALHDFNLLTVKRAVFDAINTGLFHIVAVSNEPVYYTVALQMTNL